MNINATRWKGVPSLTGFQWGNLVVDRVYDRNERQLRLTTPTQVCYIRITKTGMIHVVDVVERKKGGAA